MSVQAQVRAPVEVKNRWTSTKVPTRVKEVQTDVPSSERQLLVINNNLSRQVSNFKSRLHGSQIRVKSLRSQLKAFQLIKKRDAFTQITGFDHPRVHNHFVLPRGIQIPKTPETAVQKTSDHYETLLEAESKKFSDLQKEKANLVDEFRKEQDRVKVEKFQLIEQHKQEIDKLKEEIGALKSKLEREREQYSPGKSRNLTPTEITEFVTCYEQVFKIAKPATGTKSPLSEFTKFKIYLKRLKEIRKKGKLHTTKQKQKHLDHLLKLMKYREGK